MLAQLRNLCAHPCTVMCLRQIALKDLRQIFLKTTARRLMFWFIRSTFVQLSFFSMPTRRA